MEFRFLAALLSRIVQGAGDDAFVEMSTPGKREILICKRKELGLRCQLQEVGIVFLDKLEVGRTDAQRENSWLKA